MIAIITPGVLCAKVEAVVDAYEQSMAHLVGASSTGLACVVCETQLDSIRLVLQYQGESLL